MKKKFPITHSIEKLRSLEMNATRIQTASSILHGAGYKGNELNAMLELTTQANTLQEQIIKEFKQLRAKVNRLEAELASR